MKRLQGFIAGIIVTSLLLFNFPVFAQSINALFNVVNIKINGTQVAEIGKNYTLSNGEQIPFSISYKDTTYLPMRKLGELLGKDIGWDNETQTASVNDKVVPTPALDVSFDTFNLRSDANYDIQIERGLNWVPANALGKSNLNNSEIAEMTKKSPEERQKSITNLYEALQLFQISDFKYVGDNVRIREGGINWEHHKPGFDAVRTNEGCCASNSSWLNYILKNDYDELGFIGFSFANGSGHIINYIKENDYYYVIDLLRYESKDRYNSRTACETGLIDDFRRCGYLSGNIVKVKTLSDYVTYFLKPLSAAYAPGLFVTYVSDKALPIDSIKNGDNMEITFPKGSNVKILYDNPSDNLSLVYAEPPLQNFNWSTLPDAYIIPKLDF